MTTPVLRRTALLLSFCLPLALSAQQQTSSSSPLAPLVPSQLTGPPPAQIASAHNIFLTSAGADPNFPIDSARAYNDIYAQLRAWGHYQLVTSAADADLVLELHGVAPITGVYSDGTTSQSYNSPAFQLNIIDAKAERVIWTITSPVIAYGRGKKSDHWVTVSESNVVSRLEVLAGQSLTAEQTTNLTAVPKTHSAVIGYVVLGGILGLGVGGYFIAHHAFENSLANQKAQQDAFCNANHIPLNMCAGG